MRPTREGKRGIGWARGGAVSGSPVSCRKSTSVIPQVSTVCPVRTSIPELSSGQRAMASAPARAHPEEARGRWGRGAAGLRQRGDWWLCIRGGARATQGSCLLGATSGPSGQQVPEEAEGGARARTAHNSASGGPGNFAKPGRRKHWEPPPRACADVPIFDSPEATRCLLPKGDGPGLHEGAP